MRGYCSKAVVSLGSALSLLENLGAVCLPDGNENNIIADVE
ncbi:hypothetical protein APHMUC_0876 [Anaplasma phagocytophilum str. ApMUC09]|uniref:Uncharacterized protein n=1 Tax=Anaplasma phagocytophilum str. ApMUC09 TaxID=1359152 RepID=A0A0F3N838_ANAPH|nr:hypothetical protein APHMUC_0876 [Anaplasma phagocytophilum str. ApMUC09]